MSEGKNKGKLKKISSAVNNMSALIDDIVKKARKNFRDSGNAELDAKFLKESVSALRELYGLLGECDPSTEIDESIVIRLEKQVEEWSK
ncbi:MAG: hypothetical protein J6D06_05185 [Clostridia bacterium]|nr:hypothetical protein [Clostridia bacterium]